MYTRHGGDDLLSKDKRLKYNWKWSRSASMISDEEIKKWTHFQVSHSVVGDWELEAIQWGSENIIYEAVVKHIDNYIITQGGFKTRIEAQIGAEKLFLIGLEKN